MKSTFRIKYFFLMALTLILGACTSEKKKPEYTDTPISGDILIVVDESYKPLMQVQLDTFMKIYKYANIRVKYLPEAEAFNELMMNDSVRLAVVARSLNKEEAAFFEGRKIIPRMNKLAIDAVALVTNPDNPDTLLTYSQAENIFSGKIRSWKQLNPNSALDSIAIVFDNNGSSNSRYLQETFHLQKPLPSNWSATNSNADVINYVNKTPRALGVVSVNWISDRDDATVNSFLTKVKVVEISSADTSLEKEYYKPYQAYIALKQYPFIRDVQIIIREGRNGLGTGFASFAVGDQGQRLVRLMGMLPATMPIRILKVNS